MNKRIAIYVSAAVLLFAGQSASASGLFGWGATVTGYNPGTDETQSRTVNDRTQSGCEAKRQDAIADLEGARFHITSAFPCSRNILGLDDILRGKIIAWPPRQFPPIGGCPECTYLDDLTVDRLYPDYADRVKYLKKVYQIDEYNNELIKLQSNFKLQEFEAQMLKIEQQQFQNQLK